MEDKHIMEMHTKSQTAFVHLIFQRPAVGLSMYLGANLF